jgi:elongation factor 1-alpha
MDQDTQRSIGSYLRSRTHGNQLPAEIEEGPAEYKLHLCSPSSERLRGLITQLMWRCREGQGVALYRIGVADDGTEIGLPEEQMHASLETLKDMCRAAGAAIVSTRIYSPSDSPAVVIAEIRIKKGGDDQTPVVSRLREVRCAVVGGPGVGKSTLIACLTTGCRDDGSGSARFRVFKHRHEIESGATSSIGHHILGFDDGGNVTNWSLKDSAAGAPLTFHACSAAADVLTTNLAPAELLARSSHIVSVLDLAGDIRYMRTTIAGLLGAQPDVLCVLVSVKRATDVASEARTASSGPDVRSPTHTPTLERPRGRTASSGARLSGSDGDDAVLDDAACDHLLLAASLGLPLVVILSQIDGVSMAQLEATRVCVSNFLSRQKRPTGSSEQRSVDVQLVNTLDDAIAHAQRLSLPGRSPSAESQTIVPGFPVSSVSWAGCSLLLSFLSALQPRRDWLQSARGPTEYSIEDVLTVDGNTVVSGLVCHGLVEAGQTLLLGPDLMGGFSPVVIRSLQSNRVPVLAVAAGHLCTICMVTEVGSPLPRSSARRGQVLLSTLQPPAPPLVSPALLRHTSAPPMSSDHVGKKGSCTAAADISGTDLLPVMLPLAPHSLSADDADEYHRSSHVANVGAIFAPREDPIAATSRGTGTERVSGVGQAPSVSQLLSGRHKRSIYASVSFDAEIAACSLPQLTLRAGQHVMVYCAYVRQAARVVVVREGRRLPTEPETLSTEQPRWHVQLRLLHHPEFIRLGATVLLRDGRCMAAGHVKLVAPMDSRSLSAPSKRAVGSALTTGTRSSMLSRSALHSGVGGSKTPCPRQFSQIGDDVASLSLPGAVLSTELTAMRSAKASDCSGSSSRAGRARTGKPKRVSSDDDDGFFDGLGSLFATSF